MEAAVQAGNKFLQIKENTPPSPPTEIVRVVDEEEPKGEVKMVNAPEDQITKLLAAIMKLTEGLSGRLPETGRTTHDTDRRDP